MAPENWSNIRLRVEKKVTLWDGSGFLQAGDLANDQLSESEIAADCQLMLIGETFLDAPCKGQGKAKEQVVALVLCRPHICAGNKFSLNWNPSVYDCSGCSCDDTVFWERNNNLIL